MPATSHDYLDFFTLDEHGGLQGTDRAVTTCRLPPQPWKGKCIHVSLHNQAPRLHMQELPKPPRDPMD